MGEFKMQQYVIFLTNETWVIIKADGFIINAVEQVIEFYEDHEMIASFSTITTVGFCKYESALMRILKGQKVCNGFETIKDSVFDNIINEIESDAFNDANGVLYVGFNHVKKILEKYKGGVDDGK